MVDVYPHHAAFCAEQMGKMGLDPKDHSTDLTTPQGIGNGANQHGSEIGGNGEPYADYTYYRPVNPPDRIIDPIAGSRSPSAMAEAARRRRDFSRRTSPDISPYREGAAFRRRARGELACGGRARRVFARSGGDSPLPHCFFGAGDSTGPASRRAELAQH